MAFNLFSQKPLVETPQLTKPIQAYDPTKTVAQNMAGQGQPSAQNVIAAYQTPQAQLQMQQTPAGKPQATLPAIDPNSETSGMDALSSMYTSPQEEERLRKASVANQRIMAVADALRHIGNIYNTVNYAPAQQLNSPVLEEQARYEKGKALRDKANLTYLNYQQAKAAQDAKAKQWEATFNYNAAKDAANAAALADYRDRLIRERGRIADQNYQLGVRRADDAKAGREATLKETKRYHDITAGQRSQSLKMQRERTTAYVNRANRSGGNSSGGVAPLDTPKGRITPNGRNYSNQIEQIWSFAKEKNLVKESDVEKRLMALGLGKDKSADVRHQMVLDLLRTNQSIGDYAADRLGWSYGGGTNMDLGLEDDEDEMDLGLE